MYYFLDNLDNVKQCIGKTTGLIWNSINFVSMQITGLTFRLPRIADNNFNTQFNILKALFFLPHSAQWQDTQGAPGTKLTLRALRLNCNAVRNHHSFQGYCSHV
jgi:hypothetical protein